MMSDAPRIQRLPGVRDVDERTHERLKETAERLTALFIEHGFGSIDTPVIEETELFVRKSGGELAGRLYTFTDPGGHRVSLRPEFTSSVIRYFAERRKSLTLPVRWQYSGPVFRYEPASTGGYRQFTQVGAEVIGAAGAEADAELVHLAWAGLKEVGVAGLQLRLGHLGVLNRLVEASGLSDRARRFVIGNVSAIKGGQTNNRSLIEQAEAVGLLRKSGDNGLEPASEESSPAAIREILQGALGEAATGSTGRRTPDQIVARLVRKAESSDERARLADALAVVERLAPIEGHPADALAQAKSIASDLYLQEESFDEMERLASALSERGVPDDDLVVDFGLARGIAYYSGVTFEIVARSSSGTTVLGGGGRYDGLVKALGGGDVPALGFAYGLDQVVEAAT